MAAESLEQRLLQLVDQPGYRPAKPRMLADQLKLDEESTRELKRVIKQLVKAKKLVYGANHLVGPPSSTQPDATGGGYRVTGVFRRTQSGTAMFALPAALRAPIARKTSTSRRPTRRTPPAATRCWCG